MNPLLIMEAKKAQFSTAELAIYQTIKAQPSIVTHATTTTLAKKAGVSQPTLTRFVKKQLGYKRYQDFRFDFINWLSSSHSNETIKQNDYFTRLENLLDLIKVSLDEKVMLDLVHFIDQADHIYTTGSAKSYLSASLFEILMIKMNARVSSYTVDLLDDAASYLTKEDLLIIFSASGDSSYIRKISHADCRLLLITANQNAKFKKYFDKVLVLPSPSGDWEYDSISPIAFDVFAELFVTYYAKNKK